MLCGKDQRMISVVKLGIQKRNEIGMGYSRDGFILSSQL